MYREGFEKKKKKKEEEKKRVHKKKSSLANMVGVLWNCQ